MRTRSLHTTVSLKLDDIQKLATLARLEIGPEESAEVAEKLSGIVAFVDQLKSVSATDVTPMAHPLDATQRLRPDAVTESNHREAYQAVAPRVEQGLYLVPKVIE